MSVFKNICSFVPLSCNISDDLEECSFKKKSRIEETLPMSPNPIAFTYVHKENLSIIFQTAGVQITPEIDRSQVFSIP